jgi:hypothetical protein
MKVGHHYGTVTKPFSFPTRRPTKYVQNVVKKHDTSEIKITEIKTIFSSCVPEQNEVHYHAFYTHSSLFHYTNPLYALLHH